MMRVAITVDPIIPVPPDLYGGIERVVDLLVRGLVEHGHDVTLFAHPDSKVLARLIPYGIPPHRGWRPRMGELWQVGSKLWRMRKQFEIVHSFGRLAALVPILPYRNLAKIQSYQRGGVPWRSVSIATCLAGNSIRFTGCSSSVFRERDRQGRFGGNWRTIFNGVDVSKYQFQPFVAPEAPLAYLGRVERIKGVHSAIAIARGAGSKLVIAGNLVKSGPDADYFDKEIAPKIDGVQIEYIGPVNDVQKSELLGRTSAMLMPIEWEEPFGIVMAEAMACGTPVIAFQQGSVPEVIRDGVNGFIVADVPAAIEKVHRLGEIDRAATREDCVARFSYHTIVDEYEALYSELMQRVRRN